jgi:uncharacterized membrane protein
VQEKNYNYERFKKNVALLKKKFYRAYLISNILGIDKSVFSRYINGGIIPGDDTLDKFNSILEERLKKVMVAKEPEQGNKAKKQAKDLAELKAEIAELNKKTDRILALLRKMK